MLTLYLWSDMGFSSTMYISQSQLILMQTRQLNSTECITKLGSRNTNTMLYIKSGNITDKDLDTLFFFTHLLGAVS